MLITESTAEVYGIQANKPLKETLPLHSSNPYAVSKAAGDLYLWIMFNSFGLKGTILRSANS
jgi:nucleoside-diphosphate-sugar epimerase